MADYAGFPKSMLDSMFDGMVKQWEAAPPTVGAVFSLIQRGEMTRDEFAAWLDKREAA